jgi:hypothetical protein
MPIQKQSKPAMYTTESGEYDFGSPSIVEVEVSNNVTLRFREPDVDDLLRLAEIEKECGGNEIMQIVQTICLLHTPSESQSKITLKEAKKIRIKDLKKIGKAITNLVNFNREDEDDLEYKSDLGA